MPWYDDTTHPTEKQAYDVQHADRLVSNWNSERIPANVRAKLAHLDRSGRAPE